MRDKSPQQKSNESSEVESDNGEETLEVVEEVEARPQSLEELEGLKFIEIMNKYGPHHRIPVVLGKESDLNELCILMQEYAADEIAELIDTDFWIQIENFFKFKLMADFDAENAANL